MSKNIFEFIQLCKSKKVTIEEFKMLEKYAQSKVCLDSIFHICHLYIDFRDYHQTLINIINDSQKEYEQWIVSNNINQLDFIIYANSHSYLVAALINSFAYDAKIITKGIRCISNHLEFLPEKINSIGHRNILKIIRKMDKIRKHALCDLLMKQKDDGHTKEYLPLLMVFLRLDCSDHYSYHPSEFVRFEYFSKCTSMKQVENFIQINQFIRNVSIRMEIASHFEKIMKANKTKSELVENLLLTIRKMCRSDVKIRRELGLRLLEVLTKSKIYTGLSEYTTLAFDSYQEIRDIAFKYVTLDFKKDFLIDKLRSNEYSDIYAAAEIIRKKGEQKFYVDYLENILRQIEIKYAIERNIYGLIVLANQCKAKIDGIKLVYDYCFKGCVKVFNNLQNETEFDEEVTSITILWRTLKEIVHYMCINYAFVDCSKIVIDVLLNINHLGLISYVYELFKARLTKSKCSEKEEEVNMIQYTIQVILQNKFNLSRKGAGVALLFTAFAYSEARKKRLLKILSDSSNEFEKRLDTHVLFINIFTRLAKLDNNDQCFLFEYAFKCLESKKWQIKNAATMLFANLVFKLFGNKAFDINSKRHVFSDIREIVYKNRNAAKYLVLCFYNRVKYLSDKEQEFVIENERLRGYYRLKTARILGKAKPVRMPAKVLHTKKIEKTNAICIKIFTDLNDEEENVQDNAAEMARANWFPNVSNEYLKHLLIADSIANNYFCDLKASLRKNKKVESKNLIYGSENYNSFYDFDYLDELLRQQNKN